MSNKYTDDQIDTLKRCYPISDYDTLFATFPGKTKKQIKSLAHYYGIKNNNPGHVLDLSGQKYGMLKVESFAYTKKYKSYWKCRCECGKGIVACGQLLKSGQVKSCGCLKHNPKPRVDHTGERFGKLIAVERLPRYNNKSRTYYKCLCDCGSIIEVSSSNLVRGHTRSCGCAQKNLKEFWNSIGHERKETDPVYSVYKHTAPNGKVYIGITRQNSTRRWQNGNGYKTQQLFYRAINKFGWDSFTHEILEAELTEKEACDKEKYYIAKYHANNPKYGYNATEGGDSSTTTVQPIMQYYYGEPVNFFESLNAAGEALGVTAVAVNQYTKGDKTFKGYSFKKLPKIKKYDIPSEMYDISDANHLNIKQLISNQHREKTISRNKANVRPINQYTLNGEYIKTYPSIAEARKEYPSLTSTTINGNGRSKSASGYMWRYDKEDHSDIDPIETNKKFRKVVQIDPSTDEILSKFESLADAERRTGISTKQIYKACQGLHKTSGGYKWRYDDEINDTRL